MTDRHEVQHDRSSRVARILRLVRRGDIAYGAGRRAIEDELRIHADRIDELGHQLARDGLGVIRRADAGPIDDAALRREITYLLALDREARRDTTLEWGRPEAR